MRRLTLILILLCLGVVGHAGRRVLGLGGAMPSKQQVLFQEDLGNLAFLAPQTPP